MTGNKPIHKFRAGQIVLSVWANEKKIDNQLKTWNSISLEKCYKDGEEWKTTQTFNASDMGNMELLIRKASELININ